MRRRLAACALALGWAAGASACALPRPLYDGRDAVASVAARVMHVRGRGPQAVYDVRRAAADPSASDRQVPRRLRIRMADFWAGTCGADSPLLHEGDRITLYFVRSERGLTPRGWQRL